MGKTMLRAMACLTAMTLAMPAIAARSTPRYTSLTVFGDSLVDAGNVFTATNGAIPAATNGYFQGRFTNGYDYTDLLSLSLFGKPTTASLAGGSNFAFGGARATPTSRVPDLDEQLGLYQLSGQAIDRNGLYVLNFGGNDIFAIGDGDIPAGYADSAAFLNDAVTRYAAGVQTLAGLGARNILITGFPVASPAAVQGYAMLNARLDSLTLAPDTSLFRFDSLNFLTRVQTNPTAFGLPAFTQAGTCQSGGIAAVAGGCVGYFQFDTIHPTAAVQQALFQDLDRQFALTAAVPEPASWALMIGGFGLVGASLRRRRIAMTMRPAAI